MSEPSPSPSLPRFAPVAVALFAFAVPAYACRGGLPGVAVADDYIFLEHQSRAGFDWLGTHGSDWYWRPFSRQLYFLLLGPRLLEHPLFALGVHVALLAITFVALWSFGRRMLGAAGAVVLASAPLLMEPVRVLLAWPSAIQHLLPLAAVSCALAAAASSRAALSRLAWPAMIVAIGGHENALLVLPVIPLLLARERGRVRRTDVLAAALIAAAWAVGRALSVGHGAGVPPIPGVPGPLQLLAVARCSLAAFASLEDLAPLAAAGILAGYVVVALLVLRGPRASAPGSSRAALVALALWAAATVPLAIFLPEWNSWRNTLGSLALAFVLATLAASGGMRVALFVVALRAAALLLAPSPSALPGAIAPPTTTHISFARLTRMQRTLQSARAALAGAPRRTRPWRVRHWNLPRLTEFGFAGSRALRMWSGDAGARFVMYGEADGMADTAATVLAFDPDRAPFAVAITPEAQRRLFAATMAAQVGAAEGDSALARVLEAQSPPASRLTSVVLLNRVALQLQLGRIPQADSLHRLSRENAWVDQWLRDEVRVALALRDTARVKAALAEAVARLPDDEGARRAARAFGVTVAERR